MNRIIDRYYNKTVEAKRITVNEVLNNFDSEKAYKYLKRNPKYLFASQESGNYQIRKALEDTIAGEPGWSYAYARHVLVPFKLPIPDYIDKAVAQEGSDGIKYAWWAYEYVLYVRIPMNLPVSEEIEEAISQDAKPAYLYSRLINKRFEKGEGAISQSPEFSFKYARYILKGNDRYNYDIQPIKTILNDEVYRDKYSKYLESSSKTNEEKSRLLEMAKYIQGLEKYMEVPEIEDESIGEGTPVT